MCSSSYARGLRSGRRIQRNSFRRRTLTLEAFLTCLSRVECACLSDGPKAIRITSWGLLPDLGTPHAKLGANSVRAQPLHATNATRPFLTRPFCLPAPDWRAASRSAIRSHLFATAARLIVSNAGVSTLLGERKRDTTTDANSTDATDATNTGRGRNDTTLTGRKLSF